MKQIVWSAATSLLIAGLMCDNSSAIDRATWVGGANSDWHAANAWKNNTTNVTGDAATIMGQGNGSDGMNNVDPTQTRARNIVIGGGAQVEYYAPGNGDLRIKQGSSLTIKEGAVLVQETDSTYTENAWTQFDGSDLILDGGTLRRTGNTINEETGLPDGGGILMFGSWRADDNVDRLGLPVRMNVEIKNGGKIENEGQLWFGSTDDHPVGTEARFTINNGTMDLTGGSILYSNDDDVTLVDAELAFWYGRDIETNPKNEKWEINFTGPGSIIVDAAGINVYRQDETLAWIGGAPVSYQDLWDQGILKANGLSGAANQPADFNTFFSVSGTPGSNNYTLNSLLPADVVGPDGDFDGDGDVDGADFLTWQRGESPNPLSSGDLATWKANFGASATVAASSAVGAVPEPSALFSALVALGGLGVWRSRR